MSLINVTAEASRVCAARACPLRASIFDSITGIGTNGRCRYHDRAPLSLWPALTDLFRSTPFERALIESALISLNQRWLEDAPTPPPKRTPAEARAFLRAFVANPRAASLLTPANKDWARKLRSREEAGEQLLPIQGRAWRQALAGESELETEDQLEARLEREAIRAEGA